jgi:CRP-like cAMP-binding protein
MDALGWEPIAMMKQGDVLGALEWAEGKIWEERITAHTPTSILFIPSHLLHSLIATYPDLQRQTERYTERHNLHTLLGVHPLFQGIADQDLMRLIDLASLRYVAPGTVLFGPNMILALLFVVGRGEVDLSITERSVQTLGRGELANLEFALGEVPQLLTARVITETTLYVLPFDEVEVMLGQASRLHLLQRQAHLLRARALNE